MELEAACEQYKRALETNYVSQDQVSKMSAKFMELHVKVAFPAILCAGSALVREASPREGPRLCTCNGCDKTCTLVSLSISGFWEVSAFFLIHGVP